MNLTYLWSLTLAIAMLSINHICYYLLNSWLGYLIKIARVILRLSIKIINSWWSCTTDFQVAFEEGTTTSYALCSSQERGQMFVSPGVDVYKGQIVGIHQRPGDLSLNVCKKKAATNVRSNKEQTGENWVSSITFSIFRLEFYLWFLH